MFVESKRSNQQSFVEAASTESWTIRMSLLTELGFLLNGELQGCRADGAVAGVRMWLQPGTAAVNTRALQTLREVLSRPAVAKRLE